MKIFSFNRKRPSGDHVFGRIALREERLYWSRIGYYAVVYVFFGFLDMLCIPDAPLKVLFSARVAAPLLSALFFQFGRAKLKYGARAFITGVPYMWLIQYVMIRFDLSGSLYLAGLTLAILIYTIIFSTRWQVGAIINTLFVLPLLVKGLFLVAAAQYGEGLSLMWLATATAIVATLVSDQLFSDLVIRLSSQEKVRRNLGFREKEVREKVLELSKRKMFERQFSPQVVQALLANPDSIGTAKQFYLTMMVIDIEGSTERADNLEPRAYCEVIEEVLDVFAASCLKFNVTLDKFTGDGYMAFAGAPVQGPNDFENTVRAGLTTLEMLNARRSQLENLWGKTFNCRIAINDGIALVGFLGNGAIRNFSAIGTTVSLTHRLVNVGAPWNILIHSKHASAESLKRFNVPVSAPKVFSNLKGFGEKTFEGFMLAPDFTAAAEADFGRCGDCGTPLVFLETPGGRPQIKCPACELGMKSAA